MKMQNVRTGSVHFHFHFFISILHCKNKTAHQVTLMGRPCLGKLRLPLPLEPPYLQARAQGSFHSFSPPPARAGARVGRTQTTSGEIRAFVIGPNRPSTK